MGGVLMGWFHVTTMSEREPRAGERRLDTDEWVTPVDGQWPDELAWACGFIPVVDTIRPDDTDTTTCDRELVRVDDQMVVQWIVRPWTEAELELRALPGPGPRS